MRRVEPSMSVNTNVTIPLGRPPPTSATPYLLRPGRTRGWEHGTAADVPQRDLRQQPVGRLRIPGRRHRHLDELEVRHHVDADAMRTGPVPGSGAPGAAD